MLSKRLILLCRVLSFPTEMWNRYRGSMMEFCPRLVVERDFMSIPNLIRGDGIIETPLPFRLSDQILQPVGFCYFGDECSVLGN